MEIYIYNHKEAQTDYIRRICEAMKEAELDFDFDEADRLASLLDNANL